MTGPVDPAAICLRDPFRIDGPATLSFSGGRTSAYMLRRVLDNGIRPDVHVLFANTGKERPETLDFVHECEARWGITVHWLEWRNDERGFAEVNYATASRAGQPFESLIAKRRYLPNPVTRFCTQELKIRVMQKWARAAGFAHWTSVVGIRADEPRRVARMRRVNEAGKDRWDVDLPLADAGVTEGDVLAYWRASEFDLRLRPWEGNCDLCFLKGLAKKQRIVRDRPDLADWWIEQESKLTDKQGRPAPFRIDQPNYASIRGHVRRSPLLPLFRETSADDLGDCICHD